MILQSHLFKRQIQGSSLTFAAALVALFSLGASAHASSVIADGGFEAAGGGNAYYATGSIDGGSWNVTDGAVYIDNADPYVFDGNNSANLTAFNLDALNTLSETLSTVAGQQYTINFWADSDTANTFSVTANGTDLFGAPLTIAQNGFPSANTNGNSGDFVDYKGTFIAYSSSTLLAFNADASPAIGSSSSGSVVIDDVSAQITPEPASIFLMLTGIAAIGLAAAFKRSSLSAI